MVLQKDLRLKLKSDFSATRCDLETCENTPIPEADAPALAPFNDGDESSSESDENFAYAPEPAPEEDNEISSGCIVAILEYDSSEAVDTGSISINANPGVRTYSA